MARFPDTRWSVVLAASREPNERSTEALEHLCRAYWQPLFVFARRSGHSRDGAQDVVQGFLANVVERGGLERAEKSRGRFRSYLLGAFRHYLSHERARASAKKRGGGLSTLPLEGLERAEMTDDRGSPEAAYDLAWAGVLLAQARAVVETAYAERGQSELFEAIRPVLDGEKLHYAEVSDRLGCSTGRTRVSVHRLRSRFGEALRKLVADTVAVDENVDSELQALLLAAAPKTSRSV